MCDKKEAADIHLCQRLPINFCITLNLHLMKSDTIVTTEYIVNRRGSQQPPQIHLLPVGVSYHGVGSCDHFSDIMGSVLCFAKRHSRALVIIF